MKRAKKLLAAASARFDLPGDIVAGLPKLELTGFTKLALERHRGILAYGAEAVTIAVEDGRVRVTGRNLAIRLMDHAVIVLTGELTGIELISEGGHA